MWYAPIFLRKKGDRPESSSLSLVIATERRTRHFLYSTSNSLQDAQKARTANPGGITKHLCVYNITAVSAIIL